MLADRTVVATVAVKDMGPAKRFYEGVLGLKQVAAEGTQAVTYAAGGGKLLVYQSQFAGTNKATVATWFVGQDLQRVVQALKGKGVAFEHYDMPETKREGDIHTSGPVQAAWFKDPDGNIHAIVNS
ncbi:MAG TPA: VOC family protein [Gemmatimonadaceae bacterium]|jgi:catechol 2,3-dioxygenase-like lactoylglutathione lyase family enzyme|nr:VOC family protein [Gemmatimonadaceae bacterium]